MTTAATVNHSFNPPKKAVLPLQFMPSIDPEEAEQASPQLRKKSRSRKQIARELRAVFDGMIQAQQTKAKQLPAETG
jgi:hypothetical protein